MKDGNLDLFHIIDNVIMGIWKITESEYDYIASKMSDEELTFVCEMVMIENISFSDKRKLVEIREKYLTQINDE
jgi:hypothetical protein